MAGTCTVWDSVTDPATGKVIRECVGVNKLYAQSITVCVLPLRRSEQWYCASLPQRKFIREQPGCVSHKFHSQFKQWLSAEFPTGVEEEDWGAIMEEDQSHPYEAYPLTYPPATHQAQQSFGEQHGDHDWDQVQEGFAEQHHEADLPQFGDVNPNAYGFSTED